MKTIKQIREALEEGKPETVRHYKGMTPGQGDADCPHPPKPKTFQQHCDYPSTARNVRAFKSGQRHGVIKPKKGKGSPYKRHEKHKGN